MKHLLLLLIITSICSICYAYDYPTRPNSFSPRQIISAAEVQANDQAPITAMTNGNNKVNFAEVYIGGTRVIDDARNYSGASMTLTGNLIVQGGSVSITTLNGGIHVTGNMTTDGTFDGVDVASLEASHNSLQNDVDGFPNELKNLTNVEIQQVENIGAETISATQWGYLGGQDQAVATTNTVLFANVTLPSGGLVDGVDISELDVSTNVAAVATSVDILVVSVNALEAKETYKITDAEAQQVQNIGAETISATQWGYLANADQPVKQADSVTFNNLHLDGLINGIDVDSLDNTSNALAVSVDALIDDLNSAEVTIAALQADMATVQASTNALEADVDGFPDELKNLTTAEIQQVETIGSVTITNGQWGYVGSQDQDTSNGSNVSFGNISASGTVDGVDVAALKSDVDGFPDELKNLTNVEVQQVQNIGAETISAAQWGYLGGADQAVKTSDTPTFVGVTIGGDTLTTTEWANLDGQDQALKTSDDVTFDDVSASYVNSGVDGLYVAWESFNLGSWDMDGSASLSTDTIVATSLNIQSINVIIFKDDGKGYPFDRGGYYELDTDSRIYLYRDASGVFDSTDYNNAAINRGRVFVVYSK